MSVLFLYRHLVLDMIIILNLDKKILLYTYILFEYADLLLY